MSGTGRGAGGGRARSIRGYARRRRSAAAAASDARPASADQRQVGGRARKLGALGALSGDRTLDARRRVASAVSARRAGRARLFPRPPSPRPAPDTRVRSAVCIASVEVSSVSTVNTGSLCRCCQSARLVLRIDELVPDRAARIPPRANRRRRAGNRFHEANLRLGRWILTLRRNGEQRRVNLGRVLRSESGRCAGCSGSRARGTCTSRREASCRQAARTAR